ncbi:MAG: class I adenylate-forming enzyme family protein [Steroidobacteraceae bacterium]|jgi:acyl-CoA synthetase (AMP-forming)/AMP-acid ligase II|nr:class I adenylate-forming enzyme family protein [Steroidobacteraceae bacterium]
MTHSIVSALREVAARRSEAPALGRRDWQWTYRDLDTAINAVQAVLTSRRRGSRVALLVRNSPQYVALYYGVLAAGCVAVPLNAAERASVLARQIEHCGAELAIGEASHPEWPKLRAAIEPRGVQTLELSISQDRAATFIDALGAAHTAPESYEPGKDDLAAIIYTSGTTGRPKGVMLSHGALYSNATAIIEYLELTSADRGLCVLPFHFSYGNSVLHSHLLAGAFLALEDNFAFPQVTLQRLQDEAITGFPGVPSTFALLLGRCRLADFDLSRLRYITQAGGAMPRALIERLRAQAPGVKIFVMYGQTEATARLTYLPPERLDAKPGSVGIPIPGVEIEVRREGRAAAPNETGEIHARGPNVMLGYWNDPAATAQVLRDGWLSTGDLGHVDADGFLYIDGRSVEMIKVGAFRVSPQEVEEVLAQIDGVEEAAVTAIPDEVLGQAIKAVIVPRAGVELQVMAVKAHCRQRLASYKVPKVVELATALPRTSSGKVQRFKLAET